MGGFGNRRTWPISECRSDSFEAFVSEGQRGVYVHLCSEFSNMARQRTTHNNGFFKGRSLLYTLEQLQKYNFQPSTTKPDNIGHPTVETGQI